jgi:hypothetical protein
LEDFDHLDQESPCERTRYYVENIPSAYVDTNPGIQPAWESPNVMSEMALFLMWKQHLPERFSNFDDTPESYNAWKSTFRNIISELKATKNEELELLLNRLTGNSKLTAFGINHANPGKPDHA